MRRSARAHRPPTPTRCRITPPVSSTVIPERPAANPPCAAGLLASRIIAHAPRTAPIGKPGRRGKPGGSPSWVRPLVSQPPGSVRGQSVRPTGLVDVDASATQNIFELLHSTHHRRGSLGIADFSIQSTWTAMLLVRTGYVALAALLC